MGRGGAVRVVRGAGDRCAEPPSPEDRPPPGWPVGRRVPAMPRRQLVCRADRHRAAPCGPTDRGAARRESRGTCWDGCRRPLSVRTVHFVVLRRAALIDSGHVSISGTEPRDERRSGRLGAMGAFSPEKVLGTPADEFDADGEPDDPPAAPVPVAGEERWHDSSPARRRGELWGELACDSRERR